MDKLIAIQTVFTRHGMSYRFVREIAEGKDNAGLHRAHFVNYEDLKRTTKTRIDTILNGAMVKRTYEYIRPDYVTVTYSIVDRPYRNTFGEYCVYQNLSGNLVIQVSNAGKAQITKDLEDNEFEYPQVDEYMYDLFGSGDLEYHSDLGESGFGLTSAPGILLRVDLPVGHSLYADDNYPMIDYQKSKLWAFDRYVFEHPLEVLARDGKVEFRYIDNDDD